MLLEKVRPVYGVLYLTTMTVCAWAVFMLLFSPLAVVFLLLPSLPVLLRAGSRNTIAASSESGSGASAADDGDASQTVGALAWCLRRFFHQGARAVSILWFYFVCGLFELATGIRLRVKLDPACKQGERAIVMSNHHCHIDWYPLLCILARLAQLDHTRILLKDSLKRAPIYGWGFQCFLYIFLARRRDRDLGWIHRVLSYLRQQDEPSSLMIFPEGTDYSPENLEKCTAFTNERGLRAYKYVLHPRSKGLHAILQHRNDFDALYDCTIAYQYFAEGEVPMEHSFLSARYPPSISIHVKRYSIGDVPSDLDQLQDWCTKRFVEKDELLEACGGSCHQPMSGWAAMADTDDRALRIVRIRYALGIAITLSLAAVAIYCSIHCFWFRMYVLAATAAWAVVCHTGEGLDRWLVKNPPTNTVA